MEKIIEKLEKIVETNPFNEWSLDEKQQLLQLYDVISQKEHHILDLVYEFHGSDCYEDIFRYYDEHLLKEKATGVKIALDEIDEIEEIKKEQK
jgi:hypothetical protein